VVVHGTAEVTVNENVTLVHKNESIYVSIGSVYFLANPGRVPLELIECKWAAKRARTTSSALRIFLGDDQVPCTTGARMILWQQRSSVGVLS
jgi:hypothetical protein